MSRILAGLLWFFAVACSNSSGQGKKAAPDYFPVNSGSVWSYRDPSDPSVGVTSVKVADVERTDEGHRARLSVKFGSGEWNPGDIYEITPGGVFRVQLSGVVLEPRLLQMKYPLKEGETWSLDVNLKGKGKGKYTFRVGKKEKVVVKAGTFEAIPIREEVIAGGRTTHTMTNWYAPGVGIVKYDIPLGNVMELQKYDAGK